MCWVNYTRRFAYGLGPNAVVSPNGRMLAFNSARTVWLYDTAYGIVHQPAHEKLALNGIGFRPDGRQLLGIVWPRAPLVFDAATGRRVA